MTRKQQIIAIGGGSFASNPDNPVLERYVLAQSGKKKPAVCFIGTATGDADIYIAKFYAAFTKLSCRPSHLPLLTRTPDLKKALLSQDVIYVGGGNTKSMLAVWHEWGLPSLLKQALRRGTVLAGVSAGAICWFQMGSTDSWAGHLAPLPCLGFLRGGGCPHYDGDKERRPTLHRMIARGHMPRTIAVDDDAAAHFVNGKLLRVVAARAKARGYDVRRRGADVVETVLPTYRLSPKGEIRGSVILPPRAAVK